MTENQLATLRDRSVMITGGAGFIGSALLKSIVPVAGAVTVIDSLHPDVHGDSPSTRQWDGVNFVQANVSDPDVWDRVLPAYPPNVIIHLAAETGTGISLRQATRHATVNVVGTTVMTDALQRHGVVPDHVLLTSSRAVYGEGRWEVEDETVYAEPRTAAQLNAGHWDPVAAELGSARPVPSRADLTVARPSNVYAATKLAQEHLLQAWASATDVGLSVLRLQNVYGPGQSLTNPYTGIVALFSRLSASGESIELYEDGHITRDFVFIEDVVQAIHRALNAPPAKPRVLDVGSGRPTTLEEVAEILSGHANSPAPFISGKFREGDVRAASGDISATERELGYAPRVTLEQGLAKLLAWVKMTNARSTAS